MDDEIPSHARILDELRRVALPDAELVTIFRAVEVVGNLVRESYALGVVHGTALGREEERAQIPLPLAEAEVDRLLEAIVDACADIDCCCRCCNSHRDVLTRLAGGKVPT